MIIESTPIYGFISTGEKTAMYTLRVMSSVVFVSSFGVRESFMDSFYVQNLSTDKTVADEKANSICVSMGVPFRANADFDLNEIKRRKATEVQAEREAREAAQRAYLKVEADKFQAATTAGFMACGKHLGKTAQEIVDLGDLDYVLYAASNFNVDFIQGNWAINCAVAHQWLLVNPQPVSEFIGVVGGTVEEKLTVRAVRVCNGQFYTVLYVCVTEKGDIVKFFTTAKAFNEVEKGDVITIKGTVKSHEQDYYTDGNPDVTLLSRPKIIA